MTFFSRCPRCDIVDVCSVIFGAAAAAAATAAFTHPFNIQLRIIIIRICLAFVLLLLLFFSRDNFTCFLPLFCCRRILLLLPFVFVWIPRAASSASRTKYSMCIWIEMVRIACVCVCISQIRDTTQLIVESGDSSNLHCNGHGKERQRKWERMRRREICYRPSTLHVISSSIFHEAHATYCPLFCLFRCFVPKNSQWHFHCSVSRSTHTRVHWLRFLNSGKKVNFSSGSRHTSVWFPYFIFFFRSSLPFPRSFVRNMQSNILRGIKYVCVCSTLTARTQTAYLDWRLNRYVCDVYIAYSTSITSVAANMCKHWVSHP